MASAHEAGSATGVGPKDSVGYCWMSAKFSEHRRLSGAVSTGPHMSVCTICRATTSAS